jgi:hypothetical protein
MKYKHNEREKCDTHQNKHGVVRDLTSEVRNQQIEWRRTKAGNMENGSLIMKFS